MPSRGAIRQLALWAIGLAIVGLIATRVPYAKFARALGEGPHVALAVVDLLVPLAVLVTDTFATQIGLAICGVRWRFMRVVAIRGATYILALVNYAVGQAGLGFYLHRTGQSTQRSVGITLFLTGTTFAALLLLTTVAWLFHGDAGATLWTLVAFCGALAAYLIAIAIAPSSLVRRETFAPLFDARVTGHATAIAARVPHTAMLVLGYWIAMRTWGIAVPFEVAATVMPAVVIATVLPISPAGLGTTQAALVYLFSDFAAGATADERAANVLAFSVVHFVYCLVGQLVIGAACTALLRRQDRAAPVI
jgi:Lysylphosphatidylglycerol synthase TM region